MHRYLRQWENWLCPPCCAWSGVAEKSAVLSPVRISMPLFVIKCVAIAGPEDERKRTQKEADEMSATGLLGDSTHQNCS
jgi:hypothetical protein